MQLKSNKDIDKEITEYLNNKAEEASAPDDMFFKIRGEVLRRNERGFLNMKFGRLKIKTLLAAGVLCIATTITCIAATRGAWISSSSHLTEITKFPTENVVKDTVGFLPKYVESFDGGFEFKSFNFSNNEIQGDNGKTTLQTKSADFRYSRNDEEKNQYLSLSAIKIDEKEIQHEANEEKTNYNNVDIYYTTFQYKAVPVDYEKTEEDLKLESEGKLQIGYGAHEISEDTMQSVSWHQDGISYSILNSNYNDVSKEDMIKMAKDIINK